MHQLQSGTRYILGERRNVGVSMKVQERRRMHADSIPVEVGKQHLVVKQVCNDVW